MAALQPYPAYKDSGVEWLGRVPDHWEVRRIATVADMLVSNVDKHVKKGEQPVRLCNYVDVYRNNRISEDVAFMAATAKKTEIQRFHLSVGDVLLTKDSEDWTDIGVPALVDYAAEDLVCGYHLAMLRPNCAFLHAGYLFRALGDSGAAWQFRVAAVGVTRYGLSRHAIRSVVVPLPPLPEQRAIARFLDHADRRIRRYIRAKERLIGLLEEQKRGIIHEAVTGRIDVRTGRPYPAYKDSGVEWLGRVPAHWEVRRLKWLSRRIQNGTTPPTAKPAYYENGTVPWYGPSSCGNAEEIGSPVKQLNPVAFSHGVARMVMAPAILLVVIGATAGRMVLMLDEGSTNQQITSYETATNLICPRFLLRQLRLAENWLRSIASRATLPILDSNVVGRLKCAVPPPAEQAAIVCFLDRATTNADAAIDRTRRQINLLKEYRTRLISDVVTGKLDVREAADGLSEADPIAK